jgi:hypothetical protein
MGEGCREDDRGDVICGMRTCGFCGGSGVNQEHVLPNRLRKLILNARGRKHFDAEIERGGETHRFRNPTLEIKVGTRCEGCNRGGMSRLENEVKPFITGIVDQGETTSLDEDRRRSLVRWIVKTAMVYEFAAVPNESKYFLADERRAFKEQSRCRRTCGFGWPDTMDRGQSTDTNAEPRNPTRCRR